MRAPAARRPQAISELLDELSRSDQSGAGAPLARADLAELAAYIAQDNPAAAYRAHDEIRRQIGMLAAHPESAVLAGCSAPANWR